MTITDIGILLIVLCILLWAIMAALHRHTVQLEALKAQMASLLQARQARPRDGAEADRTSGARDNVENLVVHEASKRAAGPVRRSSGE